MCDSDIKLKHQVSVCKQQHKEYVKKFSTGSGKIDYRDYDLKGCYCKMVVALAVDNKSGLP